MENINRKCDEMLENFDDTQFLTFNLSKKDEGILNEIKDKFGSMGFEILMGEAIRDIKKEYFKEYMETYIIELKDELFIGDFEDWNEKNSPTDRIIEFSKNIKWLSSQKGVINLKVIITGFAEVGTTSKALIKVTRNDIVDGLYAMSTKNFDIWTDNLIIEVLDE